MFLIRLALGLTVTLFLASALSLKKESDRRVAPDFELKDAQGHAVRLSDYRGKVVLIDFWATWCSPCRAETPWLIELSNKYKDQGLAVVGVSMDDNWAVVKPFIAKTGITYPVILGDQSLTAGYGRLRDLPVACFVDRHQRLAAVHVGTGTKKQSEENIKALLKT
jgi:cytochrome c biogenesis protein CcmG/thiol:disulfide interchange protein DsbE